MEMAQLRGREESTQQGVAPRLWRSRTSKVFAGVAGGLAERFGMDTTLMRVLYIIFTFMSGIMPGLLVYGLLWYIMPVRDE
jgi:phage shock protein C